MEKKSEKRRKPARRKTANAWKGEIVYVFRHVCVDCSLNPDVYGEDEKQKALLILRELTKEIWIDKTYVEFKGTKFEKTFLLEEGWNALRDLVVDTDFGQKCTKRQRGMMDRTFRSMLPGYFEMMFADLGWDVDNMDFEIADDTPLDVEYMKDTAEEWKRYPGKWQAWENL